MRERQGEAALHNRAPHCTALNCTSFHKANIGIHPCNTPKKTEKKKTQSRGPRATWATVLTAYIAGVPQWWKEPTLKQVLGNKITKEVLLTKTTFIIGDTRSSTWSIQAPSVSALVGTVLRTSD